MPRVDDRVTAPGQRDEYRLLRTGAAVLDQSARARWKFAGDKAAEVLTGLVTNDVLALRPGAGLYAAALTPKGKIIADVRLFALEDGFLVDTPAAAAEGWGAVVRKFVNPRTAPYKNVTAELCDIAVLGPRAAETIAGLVGADSSHIGQLPAYSHITSSTMMIARAADIGSVPAYDVFVPCGDRAATLQSLAQNGAHTVSTDVMEIARIEAGLPAWGMDMDEATLTQEANLDDLGAISYSKGCYVGQEVVARLHFRGHVNKYLRRVAFDSDLRQAPKRGAELFNDSGKPVGDLRSVALSPAAGGVGIAMLRREVPRGATLTAKWNDESAAVRVLNEKGATS